MIDNQVLNHLLVLMIHAKDTKTDTAAAAVGGGIFKSNFDVKKSASNPPTKEVDPDDPSKPSSSSQPNQQSASASSKTPSSKIPVAFNANRRTSVSAEALNPAKLKLDSWKPPVNNLNISQQFKEQFPFQTIGRKL